jgi:hypothetical protein
MQVVVFQPLCQRGTELAESSIAAPKRETVMRQSKKLFPLLAVLACVATLGACKATGLHLKEQYPADRLIVARSAEAPVTDAAVLAVGGEEEAHSASIDQLLCAHGFAAHHPYRYLNSCARSGRI